MSQTGIIKELREEEKNKDIITVQTRYGEFRIRKFPVPDMIVDRAMGKIKNPPVPKFWNPDKEREEENPAHPDYLAAINECNRQRNDAATDAVIEFGSELLDDLPENNGWIKKLFRLGIEVDEDDQDELIFSFLKHIVFSSSENIQQLFEDVTQEGIDQAEATFPSDETRNPNPGT